MDERPTVPINKNYLDEKHDHQKILSQKISKRQVISKINGEIKEHAEIAEYLNFRFAVSGKH